jgi:hypothetical protein
MLSNLVDEPSSAAEALLIDAALDGYAVVAFFLASAFTPRHHQAAALAGLRGPRSGTPVRRSANIGKKMLPPGLVVYVRPFGAVHIAVLSAILGDIGWAAALQATIPPRPAVRQLRQQFARKSATFSPPPPPGCPNHWRCAPLFDAAVALVPQRDGFHNANGDLILL